MPIVGARNMNVPTRWRHRTWLAVTPRFPRCGQGATLSSRPSVTPASLLGPQLLELPPTPHPAPQAPCL